VDPTGDGIIDLPYPVGGEDGKQVAIGSFGSRFQNTTKRIKNS